MAFEHKERIVQEYVPGRQVTMAHIIPNPVDDLYTKLGVLDVTGAIGIFTITPSEASIIAADVASKASEVKIGFVDRFSGSLLISRAPCSSTAKWPRSKSPCTPSCTSCATRWASRPSRSPRADETSRIHRHHRLWQDHPRTGAPRR